MKKNNSHNYTNNVSRLALINTFILILIATILYFVLPTLLNYPPHSIDNDFQIEIVGIKYTHQFLILILLLVLFVYITLRIIYSKCYISDNELKTISMEDLKKIRKRCTTYPYLMLLFEMFIPAIIVAILLYFFHTETELLIRITIVVFSFSSTFAIISYMIGKKFFVQILAKTSVKSGNKIEGIRLNFQNKLLIQVVPLFLYSFVLIWLLSTSLMTTEKGQLLYHFYHQELLNKFDMNKIYTIDEIDNILKGIELQSDNDHIVIFSAKDGKVIKSKEFLNEFFIKYSLNFYDVTHGFSYEYYGQNIEGSILKLHTLDGDVFVGIRYYVFGTTAILPFLFMTTIIGLFNIIFISYIGKDTSNDLKKISEGMIGIVNSNDIVNAANLPVTSNDEIGDLTYYFNQVRLLNKNYMDELESNQNVLMERERLASLGQLIGGIAHNLKTPIMSISGAAEGLKDLVREYELSIGDSEVTYQDHHDIAKDMHEWIVKIKNYTEYMSDIITAVKGQAVNMNDEQDFDSFTLDELIKRVDILMKHELKHSLIYLNVNMKVNSNITLKGNINSLVQVIDNMISNSIQAYNGKTDKNINMTVENINNKIVISIEDFAGGLPKKVQDKLFKEMITTKGKNGTGLGLFMSYSTIRAHFNGNIKFESEEGKGTIFHIILPL